MEIRWPTISPAELTKSFIGGFMTPVVQLEKTGCGIARVAWYIAVRF